MSKIAYLVKLAKINEFDNTRPMHVHMAQIRALNAEYKAANK